MKLSIQLGVSMCGRKNMAPRVTKQHYCYTNIGHNYNEISKRALFIFSWEKQTHTQSILNFVSIYEVSVSK